MRTVFIRSLLVALAAVPAYGQGAQSKPGQSASDPIQEVARVLLKLNEPVAPAVNDLVRSLARLGPAASEQIVAIYVGAVEPPQLPEDSPAPPTDPFATTERPRLEDVLLAAIKALPPGEVVAAVRVRAMGDVAGPVRMNGIRALGVVGTARALEAFFESLGQLSDFDRARFGVEEPASTALASILASDEHCWRELSRRMTTLDPGMEGILVRGIARAGSARGFTALVELLQRPETNKYRLLEAVETLSAQAAPWVEEEACAPIRELLDAEDPEVQRTATIALGRLNDLPALPRLIGFLESEDGRVNQAAIWALELMSGLSLPAEVPRWRAWHAEELIWFSKSVPALEAKLESPDPATAVEAIAELSQHPIFRHKLAEVLARPLARGQGKVARAACAGLAQLHSARAVAPLVEALRRPEDDIREAAGQALVAITGRELPAEYDAWTAILAP